MAQRNILAGQFDAATQLADGLSQTAASGPATVGGIPRVINVGTGIMDATWIVDVDAFKSSSGDEVVELRLQGSNSVDFSSDVVNLATARIGAVGTTGASAAVTLGRVAKRFLNTPNGVENGFPPSGGYPYLRVVAQFSGTAPTITYRSFITKNQLQG